MGLVIGAAIIVVVGLVLAGLAAGWALWGNQLWAAGPPAHVDWGNRGFAGDRCGEPGYGGARGMMSGPVGRGDCPSWEDGDTEYPGSAYQGGLNIQEAEEAVGTYLAAQGYSDLELAEVMEFEANFYAIARETDTGIGAMELLVNKETGAVGPEMGPNMMWNARYGMHRRGATVGSLDAINKVSPDEALEIARRWLGANRPGVFPEEHADPFYGYYTIHTAQTGEIEGMLSVHGTTGQVWCHTWHGPFIQMIEEGEAH
jgi:hypothetical protein